MNDRSGILIMDKLIKMNVNIALKKTNNRNKQQIMALCRLHNQYLTDTYCNYLEIYEEFNGNARR